MVKLSWSKFLDEDESEANLFILPVIIFLVHTKASVIHI